MYVLEIEGWYLNAEVAHTPVKEKFYVKGPTMDGLITINEFGIERVITRESYDKHLQALDWDRRPNRITSWNVRPANKEDLEELMARVNRNIIFEMEKLTSLRKTKRFLNFRLKEEKERKNESDASISGLGIEGVSDTSNSVSAR